ncbi:pleiotropic drug resistance protein 3-like protein [Corchorus olitorius]|uniref:Pleiotropic drug resistance protein 3-like protein n=1 Tax=Corchorus olitorius TaxID=93759 RepID=A0A1R3ITD3_9ROSI|nr:pleiotropic drug resistance protein 3-like protein [Corchorus olitorius]
MLWNLQGEKLLKGLVQISEENMGETMQTMEDIFEMLISGSLFFVIKGILRPANRRKGSAHGHLNVYLNVSLSMILAFSHLWGSGAHYDEGYVGKVARFIMGLIVVCHVVTLSMFSKKIFLLDNDAHMFFPVATSTYNIISIHI